MFCLILFFLSPCHAMKQIILNGFAMFFLVRGEILCGCRGPDNAQKFMFFSTLLGNKIQVFMQPNGTYFLGFDHHPSCEIACLDKESSWTAILDCPRPKHSKADLS